MDHSLCHCPHKKCKAHQCLHQQRACLRQHCPAAINAKLKPLTKPITNCHGRFLNPQQYQCNFPWSEYLKQQWLQPGPCTNCCGRKHIAPNTQNLPSLRTGGGGSGAQLNCDNGNNGQVTGNTVTRTPSDLQVDAAFKQLKEWRLPVICVLGHTHYPNAPTRNKFCKDLACALDFLYLGMDCQVQYWADQLYTDPDQISLLPTVQKRLTTMCIQLMGDEELHLNLAGAMELIKLAMLTKLEEQTKKWRPVNGFIIGGFPSSKKEAEAFESDLYPMSLGLYFESGCWSAVQDPREKMMMEEDLQVEMPMYFRTDSDYWETEVEEVANDWGGKVIKILNMEEFKSYESNYLIGVIKDKLGQSDNNTGMNWAGSSGASGGENNYINRAANGDSFVQHAMEQMAELYKCHDAGCKCFGGGWGSFSGYADNGEPVGGAAESPMIIKCPMDSLPKKPLTNAWNAQDISRVGFDKQGTSPPDRVPFENYWDKGHRQCRETNQTALDGNNKPFTPGRGFYSNESETLLPPCSPSDTDITDTGTDCHKNENAGTISPTTSGEEDERIPNPSSGSRSRDKKMYPNRRANDHSSKSHSPRCHARKEGNHSPSSRSPTASPPSPLKSPVSPTLPEPSTTATTMESSSSLDSPPSPLSSVPSFTSGEETVSDHKNKGSKSRSPRREPPLTPIPEEDTSMSKDNLIPITRNNGRHGVKSTSPPTTLSTPTETSTFPSSSYEPSSTEPISSTATSEMLSKGPSSSKKKAPKAKSRPIRTSTTSTSTTTISDSQVKGKQGSPLSMSKPATREPILGKKAGGNTKHKDSFNQTNFPTNSTTTTKKKNDGNKRGPRSNIIMTAASETAPSWTSSKPSSISSKATSKHANDDNNNNETKNKKKPRKKNPNSMP